MDASDKRKVVRLRRICIKVHDMKPVPLLEGREKYTEQVKPAAFSQLDIHVDARRAWNAACASQASALVVIPCWVTVSRVGWAGFHRHRLLLRGPIPRDETQGQDHRRASRARCRQGACISRQGRFEDAVVDRSVGFMLCRVGRLRAVYPALGSVAKHRCSDRSQAR